MDKAKEVRAGESLDWDKLAIYLKKELPQLQGNMSVAQFHGGHANLTYLVSFGETELVVRRPPFGKIAPGAHDMKREYRVLSKLHKLYPRAPIAHHLCEDETIIGSKFVVIERRTGVVVRTKIVDSFKSIDKVEERLVDAMIKAQAELHLVDYVVADLDKLGRPEGFVERQLTGWAQRWHLSKTEENENMERVLEQLKANMPLPQRASIIHNDLKLDNCQFQPGVPDVVTSIFDWDMCTLGDPLIDLGTTLSYYPDKRKMKVKNLPIQLVGDFPPKQFLVEKYQEYTGMQVDNVFWYEAFACWKGAIVAQQLFKRYQDGDSTDLRIKGFGQSMKDMARIAMEIMEQRN